MYFIDIIRGHKKGLIIIALLLIIENVAWVIEPTVFGNLIDEFISKAQGRKIIVDGKHLLPLLIWVGIYVINSISGSFRRGFEPGTFQNIYVDIVKKITDQGDIGGLETSKITARSQLSQEYVTFLQYRTTEFVEQVIAILGAVTAVAVFDIRISLLCLLAAFPITAVGFIYYKKISLLQNSLHNNYEETYEAFSNRNKNLVISIFRNMAKTQQKIGSWNAFNFSAIRMCLLFIFIGVLYISIDLDDLTTGNIYSIVAYLWTFTTSVEYLPEILESWTSLQDITQRLKSGE
jgi:ABC-type multidrug transport system fused ATPase/permease subunit